MDNQRGSEIAKLKDGKRFYAQDWLALRLGLNNNSPWAWITAIEVFEARIQKRFLDPADKLVELCDGSDTTYGFAILSLDCAVIEAIANFKGYSGGSRAKFSQVLREWTALHVTGDVNGEKCSCKGNTRECLESWACAFYTGYRCQLFHEGATNLNFLVLSVGPLIEVTRDGESIERMQINRTKFHGALKVEFETFLAALRSGKNKKLRKCFIAKMGDVCGQKEEGGGDGS